MSELTQLQEHIRSLELELAQYRKTETLKVDGSANPNLNADMVDGAHYTPWTAYTPAWTAQTTNPVIGNGTITGRYCQVGKMVTMFVEIDMGTTTTYGSGAWHIGLPVNSTVSPPPYLGSGLAYNGTSYIVLPQVSASTYAILLYGAGTVSGTNPFTWASGNILRVQITYEAA